MLRPHRPKLDLDIDGPNSQYLTDVLDVRSITSGPMSLVAKLEPAEETIDILVDGTFGEFDVDLEGVLSGVRNFTRADVDLAARGPDIGTILRFFDRTYDDTDAFDAKATVRRSGEELVIQDVEVSIGQSSLTAEGHFPEFPTPTGANLTVNAAGPDFGRF